MALPHRGNVTRWQGVAARASQGHDQYLLGLGWLVRSRVCSLAGVIRVPMADGGKLKRGSDRLAGQRDAHGRSHNGVKIHAGCGGDGLDE